MKEEEYKKLEEKLSYKVYYGVDDDGNVVIDRDGTLEEINDDLDKAENWVKEK